MASKSKLQVCILSAMARLQSLWRGFNLKSFINFLFPITLWLPHYDLSKLKGDVIAGTTVGMMIIPQSIAFASLSGLPSQYGLYAALTPGIVYSIFGTSKDISVGPTVTMALFTYRYNSSFHPVGASALAFIIGIVLLLMAVFKLGFIAKFMPTHVLSGFISAAAITIASTQLRGLFGVGKSSSSNIIGKLAHFFSHIDESNMWDLVLSIVCLAYLAFFMWLSKQKISKPTNSKSVMRQITSTIFWFLCVARSALICVLATLVAYLIYTYGYKDSFTLAGKLPQGLPSPQFPLRSFSISQNETVEVVDLFDQFGVSLVILPTIQFIQTISIAKAFGKINDYNVDSTQELFGLGMANLIGSFFGGWPVCGSFTRSAVNAMSGTRTPLSGVFSCAVIFFAVSILTPIFAFIPKPSLSAMIIMAVVTMIDFQTPKSIWKIRKIDLIPYALAFFGTFILLEAGVLAGAVASLLIMVSREVKPNLKISHDKEGVVDVYFDTAPSYPCIEVLKESVLALLTEDAKVINMAMSNINNVDYAVVASLKSVLFEVQKANKTMLFHSFSNDNVKEIFIKAGLCNTFTGGDTSLNGRYPTSESKEEFHLDDIATQNENSTDLKLHLNGAIENNNDVKFSDALI